MKLGKWIGGFLGWTLAGPLGALAGYAIGSLFDTEDMLEEPSEGWNGQHAGPFTRTSTQSAQQSSGSRYSSERNSFLFSLLVMASYVMKADGKVMHSEMEYVRQFLRMNFGEATMTEGERILRNLFERRKQMDAQNPGAYRNTIADCGRQIADNMSYEQRLQMLSFLVQIAKADGSVPQCEIDALKEVAQAMQMNANEVDSLLNLGGKSLDEAYKVLEIEPTATDEQVRKAYRSLALKHHPDKVATLGEDVRKAAEEKFQAINAAKEMIFKARGMK